MQAAYWLERSNESISLVERMQAAYWLERSNESMSLVIQMQAVRLLNWCKLLIDRQMKAFHWFYRCKLFIHWLEKCKLFIDWRDACSSLVGGMQAVHWLHRTTDAIYLFIGWRDASCAFFVQKYRRNCLFIGWRDASYSWVWKKDDSCSLVDQIWAVFFVRMMQAVYLFHWYKLLFISQMQQFAQFFKIVIAYWFKTIRLCVDWQFHWFFFSLTKCWELKNMLMLGARTGTPATRAGDRRLEREVPAVRTGDVSSDSCQIMWQLSGHWKAAKS